MKAPIFKRWLLVITAISLCALPAISQEVTKEFKKEYTANKNTTVEISNRYGNVVVTSWDSDKVDIYVKITIEMPDKSRAEKLINLINVEFSESDNRISARTVIDDKFSFSGWGTPSRKFSINYTVKMPYYCGLDLANRYGNTDIDEIRGRVNLDIKYGNLTVTKLTREDEKPINKISISYGKGMIKEAGWLDLYLRYTTAFEMPMVKAIVIDSKYSKLNVGEISSLVAVSGYDNYRIDKINNMVIESSYSTINVERLAKKLNLEASYGSVNVNYVPEGFESINIDTRYTGVRIGIDESANYKLEGKASYGSIKVDEDKFNVKKRIIGNNSSELEGIVGENPSPQAEVKVNSSYGTVRLF